MMLASCLPNDAGSIEAFKVSRDFVFVGVEVILFLLFLFA